MQQYGKPNPDSFRIAKENGDRIGIFRDINIEVMCANFTSASSGKYFFINIYKLWHHLFRHEIKIESLRLQPSELWRHFYMQFNVASVAPIHSWCSSLRLRHRNAITETDCEHPGKTLIYVGTPEVARKRAGICVSHPAVRAVHLCTSYSMGVRRLHCTTSVDAALIVQRIACMCVQSLGQSSNDMSRLNAEKLAVSHLFSFYRPRKRVQSLDDNCQINLFLVRILGQKRWFKTAWPGLTSVLRSPRVWPTVCLLHSWNTLLLKRGRSTTRSGRPIYSCKNHRKQSRQACSRQD
jgi:hypothetical protein